MIDANLGPNDSEMFIANMIAATRMHGNPIAVFVLLAIGVALLHWLHRKANPSQETNWVPVLAFMYFVGDVFWFGNGTYTIPSDYFDAYWRALVIGIVAGTLGAIAFWLEPKFRRHHGQ